MWPPVAAITATSSSRSIVAMPASTLATTTPERCAAPTGRTLSGAARLGALSGVGGMLELHPFEHTFREQADDGHDRQPDRADIDDVAAALVGAEHGAADLIGLGGEERRQLHSLRHSR